MRYEQAGRVMEMIHELQGSRLGLSIEELERHFPVSRRTIQRMLRSIEQSFPQMERIEDEEGKPRWRIPQVTLQPGQFSADELADLAATAKYLKAANQGPRAKSLEAILAKLRAALKPQEKSRLAPDYEALLEAEGIAMRPGPRPVLRDDVVQTIRHAIKAGNELSVTYRRARGRGTVVRRLQPYGLLFGKQPYLVAVSPERHPDRAQTYALSGIETIEVTDTAFERLPDFDLRAFAQNSFGVYQETPRDIVWRFTPEAADGARNYTFHPTEQVEEQPDGGLIVRFRAGGLLEMCWHLYTWGDGVEVLEPQELKDLLARAHRHSNFTV